MFSIKKTYAITCNYVDWQCRGVNAVNRLYVILSIGYFMNMHSTQLCHNMKSCFVNVVNALMIILWKRNVGSIPMHNMILYFQSLVVCPPLFLFFFLHSLSIGYWVPLSQHCVFLKCSLSIILSNFKHCMREKNVHIVFRSRLNGHYQSSINVSVSVHIVSFNVAVSTTY